MKNRTRFVSLVAGVALAVTAVAPTAAQPTEYPRNETLYTSGTQWGPPGSWNPIQDWGYAMGTLGLVYEPLFNYDPLTNEYIPWLAEKGEWTGDLEYTITMRDGLKWADGKVLGAGDVKFTIELGQRPGVPYSGLWDFIDNVDVEGDLTVVVTFSKPQHAEWSNFLYNRAVLPAHLWGDRSDEEIMGANADPVGSGPYKYLTHDQGRMVWQKRKNWWGNEALNLDPKPKYIVDIVNGSNNVALGLVLQGGLDMSNNFLPGVATLVDGGYGVKTFYPEAPYMMSSNTAWLATNNTKPPLDDAAFRKALATSIDTDTIVNVVYGNIVKKASPTGLLPPWEMYVDQAVVDELGFSYDPEAAAAMLDEAGYVDADGDGWRDNLDGSAIALQIIVPNGWTDWMESIRVISESAKAVGINVETAFPDYNARTEAIQTGAFDLAIVNDKQLSNTPWTYYQYIFRLPIEDTMSNENYGRYENEEAWALVQQLSQTPVDDVETIKGITSQLQTIHLTDLPLTPLWYNGMWSQVSDAVWTNWPSADGNQFLPTTWRGFWQMGGMRMLDALEPVVAE